MYVTRILSSPKLGISSFWSLRPAKKLEVALSRQPRSPLKTEIAAYREQNARCAGAMPGRDELRALKVTALQMSLVN